MLGASRNTSRSPRPLVTMGSSARHRNDNLDAWREPTPEQPASRASAFGKISAGGVTRPAPLADAAR